MWIETQDGYTIANAETGSAVMLRFRDYNGIWEIYFIAGDSRLNRVCATYKDEATARKAFEDFKAKLRRNGEKIFKFKEDEANETD